MSDTYTVWQLMKKGRLTKVKEGDNLYFVGPPQPQPGVYVSPTMTALPIVRVDEEMITVQVTVKTIKPITAIKELDKQFVTRDEWLKQRFQNW